MTGLPQTVCPSLKRPTHPRCHGEGYPDWPGRARVVHQHSRAFVGFDTSKLRNAVAVAEDGRDGDVRYLGEIDTAEAATRKLVVKLAAKYRQLTFCYAAPRAVREIAWKAQMRLCARFRSLTRKGKRPNVVATAIARGLSASIWAINREVVGSHATAD